MNPETIAIPKAQAPITKRYRCSCGAILKVPPGALAVTCKKCGRTYGKPDSPTRTREMERRRRQAERQKTKGGF